MGLLVQPQTPITIKLSNGTSCTSAAVCPNLRLKWKDMAFNELMLQVQQQFLHHRENIGHKLQQLEDTVELAVQKLQQLKESRGSVVGEPIYDEEPVYDKEESEIISAFSTGKMVDSLPQVELRQGREVFGSLQDCKYQLCPEPIYDEDPREGWKYELFLAVLGGIHLHSSIFLHPEFCTSMVCLQLKYPTVESLYGLVERYSRIGKLGLLVFDPGGQMKNEHSKVSGPISDSWGGSSGKLIEIQKLTLSYNHITGVIPSEFGKLSKLKTSDLSFNFIYGSLLIELFNLSSLSFLNLVSNILDNNIADNVRRLQNLSVPNLRNNHFNGEIPGSIANIVSLRKLDVTQNNLTEEIPVSLGELPKLASFNVSYNNLSGLVSVLLSQKFSSSAFVGNLQLCGYDASPLCPISLSPWPERSKSHDNELSTKDIILIAAGALLVVLLLLCCILTCCLFRRSTESSAKDGEAATRADPRSGDKRVPPTASEVEAGGNGGNGGKLFHFNGPIVLTAEDLLCATAEIMGKSTYGAVYKGTLEDGSQVVVRRLREKLTKNQKELEMEDKVIGKIQNSNLLAMRAYYLGPKGEKLLVFDYMPKGKSMVLRQGSPGKVMRFEIHDAWRRKYTITIFDPGGRKWSHEINHEDMVVFQRRVYCQELTKYINMRIVRIADFAVKNT